MPNTRHDPYEVLGVPRDATDAQIEKKFRELAQVWHPDRYQNQPERLRRQAEEYFKALNDARQVLLDPEKRANYDAERAENDRRQAEDAADDRRPAEDPADAEDATVDAWPSGTTGGRTRGVPGWQPPDERFWGPEGEPAHDATGARPPPDSGPRTAASPSSGVPPTASEGLFAGVLSLVIVLLLGAIATNGVLGGLLYLAVGAVGGLVGWDRARSGLACVLGGLAAMIWCAYVLSSYEVIRSSSFLSTAIVITLFLSSAAFICAAIDRYGGLRSHQPQFVRVLAMTAIGLTALPLFLVGASPGPRTTADFVDRVAQRAPAASPAPPSERPRRPVAPPAEETPPPPAEPEPPMEEPVSPRIPANPARNPMAGAIDGVLEDMRRIPQEAFAPFAREIERARKANSPTWGRADAQPASPAQPNEPGRASEPRQPEERRERSPRVPLTPIERAPMALASPPPPVLPPAAPRRRDSSVRGPYSRGPYSRGPYSRGPYSRGPYSRAPYSRAPHSRVRAPTPARAFSETPNGTTDPPPAPGGDAAPLRESDLRPNAAVSHRIQVVHQHRFGACEGTLVATESGFTYDTDHRDAFEVEFAQVEQFEVDDVRNRLRLKVLDGRAYDFETPEGYGESLFVFHREVERWELFWDEAVEPTPDLPSPASPTSTAPDPPAMWATYRIVENIFHIPWETTEPGVVWAEHPPDLWLWREGEFASTGLMVLAETGDPEILIAEAERMGMTVRWRDIFEVVAAGLADTGGEITFDYHSPCFTYAQAIMPSPDWFAGASECLVDEETGQWRDEVVWTFPMWDAGTDDGDDFYSDDFPSERPQPIRPLDKHPFSPARSSTRTIYLIRLPE